jgi:hypothetical protein
MTASDLLEQPCNKSDNAIRLVTSCQQFVPNLLQQPGTSSANTTCRQLVNRFVTTWAFLFVYTRKNLTSCSKSVNKLCSHWLSWNKLLTTCSKLVDIIRLVARLFQQVRYSHDITILLQPCVVNLVTFLLYHDCIRLVRTTL